jgi:Zn finger protein HypA/HybF involved in hydrogenase expression
MHDTYLIKKISKEVQELCKMNGLAKLTKLVVTVNYRSHVNEDNLMKQLGHMNKKMFGTWTQIEVLRDDIQDQIAILHTIEGEKSEV